MRRRHYRILDIEVQRMPNIEIISQGLPHARDIPN